MDLEELLETRHYFVLTPSQFRDILGTPKQRWKAKYRRERMARTGRKESFIVCPPSQIEGIRWTD